MTARQDHKVFRWLRGIGTVGGIALSMSLVGSAIATPAQESKAVPSAAAPPCSPDTTVNTTLGPVCGLTADGVTTYGAVPYAAPPLGKLRWQSPQPYDSWTTTLQATTPSIDCPGSFDPRFATGAAPDTHFSEDCLNLTIMVPTDAKPGDKLPVVYHIHGGGFVVQPRRPNGDNLVRSGKVVYVFVNYRMGVLGFLAHKELGSHSGNYGLEDMQAGLRWVQRNIAAFGGDPHMVTALGESAGGASVCTLIASPTAKGLFQQGISVSAFFNYQKHTVWAPADCKSTYITEAEAQAAGAQYAQKVGCDESSDAASCLRHVPVQKLLEEGGRMVDPTGGGTIGPIVDGKTLTMSPAEAFAAGEVNRVPLIMGVAADEFNGGVYQNYPGLRVIVAETPAQYRHLLAEQFGDSASEVEQLYPLSRYASPFIAYRTVMADSASVCPMLPTLSRLSQLMPVYASLNEDTDFPGAAADPGKPLGAMHNVSLVMVGISSSKLSPNQAVLQDQLVSQWAHFARTGSPAAANTPDWPRYDASKPLVMALRPSGTSRLVAAEWIRAEHHCDFWDQVATKY